MHFKRKGEVCLFVCYQREKITQKTKLVAPWHWLWWDLRRKWTSSAYVHVIHNLTLQTSPRSSNPPQSRITSSASALWLAATAAESDSQHKCGQKQSLKNNLQEKQLAAYVSCLSLQDQEALLHPKVRASVFII